MMAPLATVFVLLNAADIAMTLYFVEHMGFREVNPIMARVLTWSLPVILVYKVLVPAVLVILIIIISKQPVVRRFNWRWIMAALVVGEAAVCLWNVAGLLW